jgi:hypothetical protein
MKAIENKQDLIKVDHAPDQARLRNFSDQIKLVNPHDWISFVNTSNGSNDYRTVRDRYRQVVSSLGLSYTDTTVDGNLEKDYHAMLSRINLVR